MQRPLICNPSPAAFAGAALALFAASARGNDPQFDSTSRSFHTGDATTSQGFSPQSIRVADLDGDGDLDVAIANSGNYLAPKATVLINQGDGTYGAPVFVPVGWENQDLATGDVDGDGDVDLVLGQSDTYSQGQRVTIVPNRGDATFDPVRTYPCGAGPNSLALADVDGDGDLDVITANNYFGENDVSVLRNDGAGNFSTRTDFALGMQPSKVAAGDLTGDGRPELAVTIAGAFTKLLILVNDGAGGFGAPVVYSLSSTMYSPGPGVAIADIDNDGDRDVLMSEYNSSGKVAVFANDGAGNLTNSAHLLLPYAFGSYRLTAGDVNGDGWADVLAVGLSDKYGYALIASDGAGGFLPATTSTRTGEMARAIELGDADGDGDLDVFVANNGSLTVTVHENEGGTFRMPLDFVVSGGAREIDSGDVDGDGDDDVVTAETSVHTFFSDGSGGNSVQSMSPGLGQIQAVKLVDVDLDGDRDLVLLDNSPPYEFHVLLNDGTGSWGAPARYDTGSCGPGDIAAVDYDEDGDPDFVITEYLGCPGSGSEKLWLWSNDGSGSYFFHSLIGSYAITGGEQLAVGDFDEDGHQDLITTHSDWVGFWKGHGDATFDVATLHVTGEWGPKFVTIGDFDADGHLDVATSNFGNTMRGESISVLLGDGDGTFAAPRAYFALFSSQYGNCAGIDATDVDGDGDLDLIAGAYGADDLVLLRNRGDGTFDTQERYGVGGAVRYVKAARLNGDSLPDVALSISKEPPLQSAMTFLFGVSPDAAVTTYCTAGTTTNGCNATMSASGIPSVAATSGFVLTANGVEGLKQGLIFYGVSGAASAPWGAGSSSYLCVTPPVQRTGAASSGGTADACDGSLSIDFLDYAASYPAALGQPFAAGDSVWSQAWFRDPPAPRTTNLSNGLEFTLAP